MVILMRKLLLLLVFTILVVSCAKSEFLSPEEAYKIARTAEIEWRCPEVEEFP